MAVEPGSRPPTAPLLACGRDAAAVWDRASAGRPADEHEQSCAHCAAARADAGGLGALVARMAAEPIDPPRGVVDRVVAAVRSELRPHELLRLDSPEGPAYLSATAAAGVLRGVVDRMDGMRARSCRIVQTGAGSGPESGMATDVTITVTARFGVDMASVAARVRQRVLAATDQALGLPVRRVDLEIVDVYETDHSGRQA